MMRTQPPKVNHHLPENPSIMNTSQNLSPQELLLALEAQLLGVIEDSSGSTQTVELDQAMVGRLSRMDAMQHQEMAKAQRRRAQTRLIRVRQCLEWIAHNDDRYGLCEDCMEPIPVARLCALPDADCCVPCLNERAAG